MTEKWKEKAEEFERRIKILENNQNEIKIRLKWFADAIIEANLSKNITDEARNIKARF